MTSKWWNRNMSETQNERVWKQDRLLSPFTLQVPSARGHAPAWVIPSNALQPSSNHRYFPRKWFFEKNYLKWEDSRSNFGTARSNAVIRRISHVYRVLLEVIYMQVKQISPTFLWKCQIPYWFTRFTISLTSEGLPPVWITRLWPPSNIE